MRQILVDFIRESHALTRGGAPAPLSLDDALKALAEIDPRKARVLEMRSFGGLTAEEIGT